MRMTTRAILLTDSTILLQKVESGTGSPNWNVSMADSQFENSIREMTEQIDWWE